jgi:uncharacterized protein YndB with AHSA1/START domain
VARRHGPHLPAVAERHCPPASRHGRAGVPAEQLVFTSGVFENEQSEPRLVLRRAASFGKDVGTTTLTVGDGVQRAGARTDALLVGLEEGSGSLDKRAAWLGAPPEGATVSRLADRDLVIQRAEAPRTLLWNAITRPEHARRRCDPRSTTLVSWATDLWSGGARRSLPKRHRGAERPDDIDLRPDAWRAVLPEAHGDCVARAGLARERRPPSRVSAEVAEAMPTAGPRVTGTLDERGGTSTLPAA